MKIIEQKGQQFAIRLSLAVGILMLIIKWYAYNITGSSAILSDAAESVVHIVGVGFAVFSMWLSLQPPDKSHPYGHDKISYFSAGAEGGLIVLAAFYIIYISVRRLIEGIEISNLDTGTFFTFSASVINLVLGGFLVWKGKKTKSIILIANGKHVLTDSWTSFGVVAGLVLTLITGWLPFDPIVAILAAVNILWSGGKLIRQSAGGLMDESNMELRETIVNVLDAETIALGLKYHELRYRESGNLVWIEFHLLFPQGTLLDDAHRKATEIETSVKKSLNTSVNIVTHLEPLEKHDELHAEIHN
ncbi:MAG: cation diffusion facilitator family transporter [Bacteroidetes bacterium]|nr:cation diffusion facilitator family transporter [Bacteroidota bacterium]